MDDAIVSELHFEDGVDALERNKIRYTLDDQRRAALADVDNATFSLFHVKVALVAGVGFFTDAYDIFAISIASTMLAYVYTPCHSNALPTHLDLGVKVATPVGTLLGQLVFGWLADVVGRKRMYGAELMIIIVGCFAQTLAGSADSVNVFGVIIVWRFIMGIGIGGDYPLSAVISSEFSSTRIRGRLMTAVFASQGWGNFTASLVSLVIVSIFKPHLESANNPAEVYAHVDLMWRLLIGLGCIPACIALYFRLTIPETPRFTMDIERNVKQASDDVHNFLTTGTFVVDPDAVVQRVQAPKATRSDFLSYFSEWKNLKVLVGTSCAWFLLDIAFYGLGLNSAKIFNDIGFAGSSSSGGNTTVRGISIRDASIATINVTPTGLDLHLTANFTGEGTSIFELLNNISVSTMDFTFDGVTLNSTSEANITHIAFGNCTTLSLADLGKNVSSNLRDVSVGNIIISAGGLIPGYYATFFTIDTLGRKPIQYMGFGILSILFLIMGFGFDTINASKRGRNAFVFLYCLVDFFQNFGPNTTTFIIPGELFPTRYRSTAHGISAASGKLGAIVAQVIVALTGASFKLVLEIFAFFMIAGLAVTNLIPETNGRTLEDLSNESQEGFIGEVEPK